MTVLRMDDVLAGDSPAAQRLREQLERVARTPRTTVLLLAERGLAPARIAHAIHERSSASAAAFHALDCGELTADGHAGRLSGALGAPAGGTLFLGGVSRLSSELQATLLEALEGRAGAVDHPGPRVVASTDHDLEIDVQAGRLREDVFYRLNVLSLRVPPLRERTEDLASLAAGILRGAGASWSSPGVLSPEAVETLREHDWPGNLFELEAVLALALVRAEAESIHPAHLELGGSGAPAPGRDEVLIPLPPGKRTLKAMEEAVIRRVLDEEGGNRSKTARVLGINRTTLYNKLRLYGIHK